MDPEVHVQTLLEKIKSNGIEEAKKSSEEILDRAKSEAEAIIEEANQEAARLVDDAKASTLSLKENFEITMAQGGRDLILGLKNEITGLFDKLLRKKVAATLTVSFMKDMILKILEQWKLEDDAQLEILINEKDAEMLEEGLYHALYEDMRGGVMVKPVKNLEAGFRIGEKDGNMHYDVTHKGIVDVLKGAMNPRIAKFLDE